MKRCLREICLTSHYHSNLSKKHPLGNVKDLPLQFVVPLSREMPPDKDWEKGVRWAAVKKKFTECPYLSLYYLFNETTKNKSKLVCRNY